MKDYIKKVALSEVTSAISNNIKLRKSGKLKISYLANKTNKEYLIESLLKKSYPFEVSFDSGYKIDANLVDSKLKYFYSSLMNDQRALVETSIFSSNQKSESKLIIVYLKKFEAIANQLREKYPNNRFELVEGLEFENFTKKTCFSWFIT